MAHQIATRDFARVLRQRFERDRQKIEKAALDAAQRAEAELVAKTRQMGLVDQSQYIQGWRASQTGDGARIGNDAPHSAAIEYGRRPGRPGPPLDPIRDWVRRKLQPSPEELEGIARAIRNKIHRDGSPPKMVLISYRPRLKALLQAAVRRRLRRRR